MAYLPIYLVFLEMWADRPDLSSNKTVLVHKMMVGTIWVWLDVDPFVTPPMRIESVTVYHRDTVWSTTPKELHHNYTHPPFRCMTDWPKLPEPIKIRKR
jgi:hypothetical protein